MSIKHIRPLSPKPATPRMPMGMTMGRSPAKRVGDSRAQYLQDKLRESITERRRLAAAHAGMPQSTPTPSTGSTMNHSDVQGHIKAYIDRKGSWIERRIARLQSEVKSSGDP